MLSEYGVMPEECADDCIAFLPFGTGFAVLKKTDNRIFVFELGLESQFKSTKGSDNWFER